LNVTKSSVKAEYSSYLVTVKRISGEKYHFVYDIVPKSGASRHVEESFTFDGKERPSENTPGLSEISEHLGESVWKTSIYRDGRLVGELTVTVSSDDKSAVGVRKDVAPNRDIVAETYVFDRK
jgi:hypothetical protein